MTNIRKPSQLPFRHGEFMTTAQKPTPTEAVQVLREALTAAGIVLPSLGADTASPDLNLINLRRGCA